ncbi:rhamnan synthesis F family protein [Rhodanobacter thiooxydans]|uniref:rhamnan synthesis F family protein n=1 Tax=Rhodanobacter thiooxydans TaxID=416169 RepID=UPI00030774D7|nr:rhamnan synthesis F family protein [Rhodanobacter thiooxydans]
MQSFSTFRRRAGRVRATMRLMVGRHGGFWKLLRHSLVRVRELGPASACQVMIARLRWHIPAPQAASHEIALDRLPSGRTGIMIHVFYIDLWDEIEAYLRNVPFPYTLLISVVHESDQQYLLDRVKGMTSASRVVVKKVENRGRDIAPFLVSFREEILGLDYICHIHTKKSLFTGSDQKEWRRHLFDALLGSRERVHSILCHLEQDGRLGILYPETFHAIPYWGHGWLSNKVIGAALAQRLSIPINIHGYVDYPAGSMFWARTSALSSLFSLGLKFEDFPDEAGQKDGTLQHAIERLFVLQAIASGYRYAVILDGIEYRTSSSPGRGSEGYFRHWAPFGSAFDTKSKDARLISFDVFDTLVLRPFLTPDGARRHLEARVYRLFGLGDFCSVRREAEIEAVRLNGGNDATIEDIYKQFGGLIKDDQLAAKLCALEVQSEEDMLKARPAVVAALRRAVGGDARVIGVSDMYLPGRAIEKILSGLGVAPLAHLYVSSETHWRKDRGAAWTEIARVEGVTPAKWLHVGDNEHSDIQLPQEFGLPHPVPVLRPSALLDLVPSLRGLDATVESLSWLEDLCIGLVANRFALLADTKPEKLCGGCLLDDPVDLGYTVYGPVVFAFLAWMSSMVIDDGIRNLLFLSREGHLLTKAFDLFAEYIPELGNVRREYFLASRLGCQIACIERPADLEKLFGGRFKGDFETLVRARLGEALGDVVLQDLSQTLKKVHVELPAVKREVCVTVSKVYERIQAHARGARGAYQEYWSSLHLQGASAVVDVGFNETIQKLLMELTKERLHGYYFATTEKANEYSSRGVFAKGYYGNALNERDTDNVMLRYNLLLESVLTAPSGQFQGFVKASGGALSPVYRADGISQREFHVLDQCHSGILAYIKDVLEVVGVDVLHGGIKPQSMEEGLRRVATGEWSLGSLRQFLYVEDDYTGIGEINVADYYSLS